MKDGMLRGCIGTFESKKLGLILAVYSILSAVKDRRFPPMSIKEIN